MTTNGLLGGQTTPPEPGASPITKRARFAWTPAAPADVPASSPEDETASLSSGPTGHRPASSRAPEWSLPLAETVAERAKSPVSDTDCSDPPRGVVVSLVLLGAAFVMGGLAGFLLALLLR